MLLFSPKETVSMTWDRNGVVCGLRMQKRRGLLAISRAVCLKSMEAEPLSVSLAKAWNRLSPDSDCRVVIGGRLPSAVCLELAMPKLPLAELTNALSFELPRRLPTPIEDLVWHYRVVGEIKQGDSSLLRCRIFAVQMREWMHMIGEIDAAKLRTDVIVSPFMAPQLDAASACLDGIEEFFELRGPEDNALSRMIAAKPETKTQTHEALKEKYSRIPGWEQAEHSLPLNERDEALSLFLPALLLAEYGFEDSFRHDAKLAIPLPEKFRPQRSKALKAACLLLTLSAALLAATYTGRAWWDARSRLSALRSEKAKIGAKIRTITEDNSRNKKLDLTIKSIYDANPGNPEVLHCLQYLSQNVPSTMWVIDFNSTNEKIEMTIKTSGDAEDTEFNTLAKTPFFSTENIRKRRNSDGSTDIFLRLLYANSKGGNRQATQPPPPPKTEEGRKNG